MTKKINNTENLFAKNISLNEYIGLTNKAFMKANKARRRVLIVKDALIRFDLQNLKLIHGNYVNLHDNSSVRPYSTDSFKDFINTDNTICNVCAKGALFCSIVGRVNNVLAKDALNSAWSNNSGDKPHELLLKYFDVKQLDMIETAYEGRSYLHEMDDFTENKCVSYYKAFNNDNDRFMAICNNIIKNKGEFIL